jgi:EmrB/QacA subfamily drug resistance transporter
MKIVALYLLCLGVLMIILDTTVVTAALPSILQDLRAPDSSLTWIMNAYVLTFGGFLLLSGRLADLYGRRRLFVIGLGLFTVASLICGLALDEVTLLLGRIAQGLGAAVVTAVSLSLLLTLFPEPEERARAMGIFGFITAGGGSVGEIFGGVLTRTLGWHWVFLVNLPIGVTILVLCLRFLPPDTLPARRVRLDVTGATSITTALTALVYALDRGREGGWASTETLGLLGIAGLLLVLFFKTELRASEPLIPLRLFRLSHFAAASGLGSLWAAGSLAWLVMTALYLQRVLGFNPLQVGLAFTPATVIMGAFSAGLSAKVVLRFGVRCPLWIGLTLAAAGLALLARTPSDGTYLADVLPAMILLGLGGGLASNALLLAAMNGVDADDTGIASGLINTAFMLGGALGLAVLAGVGETRTEGLRHSGAGAVAALNSGYHLAFFIGAILTATAAVYGALALRPGSAGAPPMKDGYVH